MFLQRNRNYNYSSTRKTVSNKWQKNWEAGQEKSLQMRKISGRKGKQQLGKGLGIPAGDSVGDLCALCLKQGGGLKTVSEDDSDRKRKLLPALLLSCATIPWRISIVWLEERQLMLNAGKRSLKLSEGTDPWKRSWSWSYLHESSINITSSLDHCMPILNFQLASPTTSFIGTNRSKHHSYRNHTEF